MKKGINAKRAQGNWPLRKPPVLLCVEKVRRPEKGRGTRKSRTTDYRRKSKAKRKKQMQNLMFRKVSKKPVGIL